MMSAYACGFPYFTVGTGALLFVNGHILLLKRKGAAELHPHQWGVPGGYAQGAHAEAPYLALRREICEELGQKFASVVEGQITAFNTAYIRPNMERNSLAGRHPDAPAEHANLHCLWVVNVTPEEVALIELNKDEHDEWKLFPLAIIQGDSNIFVPWLAGTLKLLPI